MDAPPFNNLSDWLAWQETLHPQEIELGLDRVREVASRLNLLAPKAFVISVGGTNGKGSSVAMLANALEFSGYRVGAYTSPHLIKYNERICINGVPCSSEELCEAFEAINDARSDISLTYFEFGTLAALYVFAEKELDVVLLEVGLGGRLDAVNIIDAEAALVTNVGLDHIEWLGSERSVIATEKAGILRSGQLAVYNDNHPESALIAAAETIGCELNVLKTDYDFEIGENSWQWSSCGEGLVDLQTYNAPDHQIQNAAGVLKLLQLSRKRLELNLSACAEKLLSDLPDGRGQCFSAETVDHQQFEVIVDVAHNRESVEGLVLQLKKSPSPGKTYALFAVMKDKPINDMIDAMNNVIDEWYVTGLPVPRACAEKDLKDRLELGGLSGNGFPSVESAWQALLSRVTAEDRVVVFGSFVTVEAILKILPGSSPNV